MSDFDFDDLAPQEKAFPFRGKTYVIKEPTAGDAAAYKAALAKGLKFVDGKPAGTDGAGDAEVVLVARCLFERAEGRPDTPVPANALRGWPARVHARLFAWAEKAGGLGVEETEESLSGRLAETQERLDRLRSNGSPEKNSSAPTEAASA